MAVTSSVNFNFELAHHSTLKTKDGNDGVIISVSSLDQLRKNLDSAEKRPLPEEVPSV